MCAVGGICFDLSFKIRRELRNPDSAYQEKDKWLSRLWRSPEKLSLLGLRL